MRDLSLFSRRQLLVVWIAGLALSWALVIAARALQRPVGRAVMSQSIRYGLLQDERARELDSLYQVYAHEHPGDSAAQLAAARQRAAADSVTRKSRLLRDAAQRGALDTSFALARQSMRNPARNLLVLQSSMLLRLLALLVPAGLVVLSFVWFFRGDRSRSVAGSS